jgi:hypothetical protein
MKPEMAKRTIKVEFAASDGIYSKTEYSTGQRSSVQLTPGPKSTRKEEVVRL